MTLRTRPIEETATLPDGRAAVVRIGVPDDPYIAKSQLDTVAVEVRIDETVVATVNTVLDANQVSEARTLALEIVSGLEAGTLEPTAGAIEPLADTLR